MASTQCPVSLNIGKPKLIQFFLLVTLLKHWCPSSPPAMWPLMTPCVDATSKKIINMNEEAAAWKHICKLESGEERRENKKYSVSQIYIKPGSEAEKGS